MPGADRKFDDRIAASTSGAVTPREDSFSGSSQTRIANFCAPRISICATPWMFVTRGLTTRSRYSFSSSGDMFGFCTAKYISAKVMPVPLTITGSSVSCGS